MQWNKIQKFCIYGTTDWEKKSKYPVRICNTQPKSSIRNSSSRNLFKLNCPSTFVSHNASKLFDKKKNCLQLCGKTAHYLFTKCEACVSTCCCLVFRIHPFQSDVLQYLLDVLPSWTGHMAGALPQAILQGQEAHWMNTGNIGLLEKYLFNSNLFPKLRSYCGIGFWF